MKEKNHSVERDSDVKKCKGVKSGFAIPFLFSIPLNVYSDEMERERDQKSFLRIQEIRKKCEQLRENLESFSTKHSSMMKRTQFLVLRSHEVNKNFPGRKFTNGITAHQ